MLNALATIIMLLSGCGEGSTPLVDIAMNPKVVDAPCDFVAQTEAGMIYYYAEARVAAESIQVFTCTVPDLEVLPQQCERTTNYRMKNGVARVLCGTFTEEGVTKADFVRVGTGGNGP